MKSIKNMRKMISRKVLNETIINGSRVFIENGKVKTVLNEDIQKSGYMSLDDSKNIVIDMVKKNYAIRK